MPEYKLDENERREDMAQSLTSALAEYLQAKADLSAAQIEYTKTETEVANAIADYLGGTGPALRRSVVVTIKTGKLAGKSYLVTPTGGTDFTAEPVDIVK